MCSRGPAHTPFVHPAVFRVFWIIGEWAGEGKGEYPTIENFDYKETTTFQATGKPFLSYTQKTIAPDGTPLHTETGYLRCPMGEGKENVVELVVSDPTGVVTVFEGVVEGKSMVLKSTCVGLTSTAKSVTETVRQYKIDPATSLLTYSVSMAAVGHPLTHHLSGSLSQSLPIHPVTRDTLSSLEKAEKPVLFVDVRSEGEYKQGHLEGAVLIPHTQVVQRVGELKEEGGDRDVMLICRTGKRSTLAAHMLFGLGYGGKVYELKGGVTGNEGIPLVQ